MSRSELSTEFNTFVGGILTEANPINFPVGYSIDEENFILERNGTRSRRFGTTLDESSLDIDSRADTEFAGNASNTYRDYFVWRDAAWGGRRQDILVLIYDIERVTSLNTGTGFLFYSMIDSTDISNNFLDSYIIQEAVLLSISNYKSSLSITYRAGSISGSDDIFTNILTRDDTGSTFNAQGSLIEIRDFKAVSSSAVGVRPATLTDNHAYNLYNNGWLKADVDAWFAAYATYPSISDSAAYSKDFGGAYNTTYMNNTLFGTSRAALGRSIVTPWYPSNDWYLGVFAIKGGAPTTDPTFTEISDRALQTVVSTSFFSSRLFYLCSAGKLLSNGSTFLMYSQNGSDSKAYSKCYQINDPTAEVFNSPLDTDGGLLDVSEIGEGLTMNTSRSRMLLFGTEGVYELFSPTDVFKPIDIAIRKVTDTTINYQKTLIDIYHNANPKQYYRNTANSVITAGDNFYYWGDGGITSLVFNTDNNQYVESNMTSSTIASLYRDIPTICKAYATGIYNIEDNTLAWAYSEDSSNPSKFSKLLCYDMVLNAWYKVDHATSSDASIIGLFNVARDADLTGRAERFTRLTYLTSTTDEGLTTSYPIDTSFQDFVGSTYVDESPAFLQTGYLNANDSAKYKQGTYIVPSFIRTEDGFTDDGLGNLTPNNESSCMISAWWDYAEDDTDVKVNAPFEAYKYNRLYIPADASDTFDYGQSVITTKNRLTGRGRALSLRFESSVGKDCRLLGWNLGFGAVGKV